MICILAGNPDEAKTWAKGQNLSKDEWFYPKDEDDLKQYSNFHVIVIGTAGFNTPTSYFDRIYQLARMRGRHGRTT